MLCPRKSSSVGLGVASGTQNVDKVMEERPEDQRFRDSGCLVVSGA